MASLTIKKRRLNDDVEEETNVKALPVSIPYDLTREILLQVPAKSLLRFRCVSKLFRSLSLDPGFVKSHLAMITRDDSVRLFHSKLIVASGYIYAIDLDSIGEGIRAFKAVVRSNYTGIQVHIVGSSNGLLCIYRDEDDAVFLWNPTTREIKQLPEAPNTLSNYSGTKYTTYGFGFHVDDYKVVKLIGYGDNIFSRIIYSLKGNSWGQVYPMNYEHDDSYKHGVHLNGAIHWVFILPEGVKKVVAFNLETEEFQEMLLPDQAWNCNHQFKNFEVGIVYSRLCLIYSCTDEEYSSHKDIWVMHSYGDATSWYRIRMSLSYPTMATWCSTKNNDEVLLEVNHDMVLYNFKTHKSRKLGVQFSKFLMLTANTCIETLISPNMYV